MFVVLVHELCAMLSLWTSRVHGTSLQLHQLPFQVHTAEMHTILNLHHAGGHMIAALVSGEAAVAIEAQSDAAVLQRVVHRLRTYHPDCSIPDPVAAAITAWGRDPYTLGSYSSVPPGCNGADDYNEVCTSRGHTVH